MHPHIARAIQLHKTHGSGIVQFRERVCALCEKLADVLRERNEVIVRTAHEWLRPILANRHIAFMVEFNYIVGCEDHDLFCDLAFGLPMLGWARHSPVLVQRASNDPVSLVHHDDDLSVHNEGIIRSLGPSRSPEQDVMAWDKCLVDFKSGGLVGPFYSYEFVCTMFGGLMPR